MATRQTATSTDPTTAYARAVEAGEIVAGPFVRASCRRHLDDLITGPARGLMWDAEAAERFFGYCSNVLTLSEGQFEGLPFDLEPSQQFICGSLFGWKWAATGKRRFRRAYIEIGKGNGKSPMIGAVGLYGLGSDDEWGAEIYSAGATKDQAAILFRDAIKMVDKSRVLSAWFRKSGGAGRENNLAFLKTQLFFRPVSRETKKTGSGPRPHMALCDEVHEHPDGGVIEILERGFKFRQQPLLVMITNAGSDRQSHCWTERKHAVAVAQGDKLDDTTFILQAYVNGVLVAEYLGDTSALGNVTNFTLQSNSSSLGAYFSEVMVATHDIKAARLKTLGLTGAGAAAGWVGAMTDVNAYNSPDSTFLASDTVGQVASYAQSGLAADSLVVDAVIVAGRVRRNVTGPDEVEALIRTGGANYGTTFGTLTSSFVSKQVIFPTNPGTAAAWTRAEVTALEIGVRSKAA